MAGQVDDEGGTPGGGAPAQGRELRARGRRTMVRLLDAGRRVFARRGYHAARVDDIVRAARTSHGTFYLYFSDKQDLLVALARECRDAMGELAEGLGPVTADQAGFEAVREFVGRFLDACERYRPVLHAWPEGAAARDGERPDGHPFDAVERVLGERIRGAGGDGALGVEAGRAATALVAMLERFGDLTGPRRPVTDSVRSRDSLARMVHAGFFAAKGVNQANGRSV